MTKRLVIVGLSIATILVFGTSIDDALAKPSFVPSSGKFPVHFTGVSTSAALKPTLTSETANPIECEKDTSSGEISASMEMRKVVVVYTGCKTTVGGFPLSCGTITTTSLAGQLGYVNHTLRVGVMFVKESGPLFASFKCGPALVEVGGTGVIGEIPFSELSKQGTIRKLAFNSIAAKQELTELELLTESFDKPELTVIPGGKAGLMSEDTLTSSEEVEVEG